MCLPLSRFCSAGLKSGLQSGVGAHGPSSPSVFFQGRDVFTVDVSNGFTTVEDLHVSVDIVPRLIPVQTFNFSVKEGLSWPINAEIINISHPFYSLANIEFFVEESPQHGDIRYLDGDELAYFTWEEVGEFAFPL